jgi:ribulose-phosphate 3-epimerase
MLKCDFGNLQREIERLEGAGARVLHLDVMDGHFVPNLSYGPVVIERMRPLTELPFDAHLMISEPARYVDDFRRAGCDLMTVHLEAVPDPRPVLEQIRDSGSAAGLSINPGTPVSSLEPFLPWCDLVLVMSVQPGFGGQKFMPVALDKLRWLKEHAPAGLLISVDGGIGAATAGETARAGAQVFVVGSAIFDSTDYGRAMGELADEARANLAQL